MAPDYVLRGTITAPAGSDVKGTIIMACNIEDCLPQKSANAEVFTVDTTGLTAQFNITLLAPGKYQVIAVNTVQGLIGVYKNPADNSNTVENTGFGPSPTITITLSKGVVPAKAMDLFKTELSPP
jgi:hypothetical protein